jgi:hypothetical protein
MHGQVSRWSAAAVTALLTVGTQAGSGSAQQRTGTQQQQQEQKPSSQQQQQAQQQKPVTVDLDALEDAPEKYLGKTVVVEGEVDRVLGPDLFTIDERDWADLEREMPVVLPEPFTAVVRSDAPVRVTGVVRKVPIAEVERRGWFGDAKIRAEIEEQPALVASEVTTIAPAAVSLRVRADEPVGTTGTGASAPVTDASEAARSRDTNMVGRRVDIKNARVNAPSDLGFWIQTPGGERIFVMPAMKTGVREGQAAAIQGVVLELPEGLRVKLNASSEPVYIYAERVTAQ